MTAPINAPPGLAAPAAPQPPAAPPQNPPASNLNLPTGADPQGFCGNGSAAAPSAPLPSPYFKDGIVYSSSFLSNMDRKSEQVIAASDPLRNPIPVTRVSMQTARRGRPVIVEEMYFADVGHIAAPGSTGKTTVLLHHCIQIAIGGNIFGHEVLQSGPVVYVTAEDDAESIQYRLGQMCKELELSKDDVDLVCMNVHIIDVTGHSIKLTQVEKDIVVPSARTDTLIATLKAINPVMVFIDPAISFGVGESRVNDAEQGLIEVGRRIVKKIGCGVIFVHHTGKANARESTLDQYSGRGGSALADGSRMVFVMQPLKPNEWIDATGDVLEEGELGFVFASPKLTWCPPQAPVYLKRTNFTFTAFNHISGAKGIQARTERDAETVLKFLKEEWLADRKHTSKALEAVKIINPRASLRAAVEHLLDGGKIIEDSLNIGQGRPRKLLRPCEGS